MLISPISFSLSKPCLASNPSPSRRAHFLIYTPPSPPISPSFLTLNPRDASLPLHRCFWSGKLSLSSSSPIPRSHPFLTVHPLHLQQARAYHPQASFGHNLRGSNPLVYRFPLPLRLSTFHHPLLICHLLLHPCPFHRVLSSVPIPPSRVLPRHPHQQAHKVVGRLGNLRRAPLHTRSRIAQEVRPHRQSWPKRVVNCRCHRDSRCSRLRWFTKGSLYASFH